MNIGTHIVDDLYTIRDMLAQGPLGPTFLATDRLTDAPMVIKPIPAELTRDQGALIWFQQRYQRLKGLKHPVLHTKYNHAYDQASGRHYMTAPFVPGEHLGLWLKRQKDGRVDLGKALTLTKRIAEALDMAHQAGLPHLSLKLENVIVTPDESIILVDHALSYARHLPAWRRLDKDLQPAHLISCFTAPEIIQTLWLDQLPSHNALRQANEDLKGDMPGVAADIYALGAILFTMLTGQPPFTANAYLEALAHGELPSLHMDQHLPLTLHAHLAHAMERTPSERYASTTALMDALLASWKQWERQASRTEHPTPEKAVEAAPVVLSLAAAAASNDTVLELEIDPRDAGSLSMGDAHDFMISSPEDDLIEDLDDVDELPILDLAAIETQRMEKDTAAEQAPDRVATRHNPESMADPREEEDEGTLPMEMHEEALLELQHEDLLDDPDGHSHKIERQKQQEATQPAEAILVDMHVDDDEEDGYADPHADLAVEQPEAWTDAETNVTVEPALHPGNHDQPNGRPYETIGRPLDHLVDEDEVTNLPTKKRKSSPLLRAAAVAGILVGAGMGWFLLTQEPQSPFQIVELQPTLPFMTEQPAPEQQVPQIKAPEDLTLVPAAPESLRKDPALRTRAVLEQLDNHAAIGLLRQQLTEVEQKHDEATAALDTRQNKLQKLEQDLEQTQNELDNTRQALRNANRELADYANARMKIGSLEERVKSLLQQRDGAVESAAMQKTQDEKRVNRLEQRLQANKERYRTTQLRGDEMLLKPEAGEIIPNSAPPRERDEPFMASQNLITPAAPPAPRSASFLEEDEKNFTATKGGLIYVQVASHGQAAIANAQRNTLANRTIHGRKWPVVTQQARVNGQLYHRVRFGPLASAEEATTLSLALSRELKMDGIMVRKRSQEESATTAMLAKQVAPIQESIATGRQARGYSVQVAAFSTAEAAQEMEMKMQTMDWPTQDLPIFREAKMVDGRLFHRVRIGPFAYKNQAARMNALVHERTHIASIVVNHRITEENRAQVEPKPMVDAAKVTGAKVAKAVTRPVPKVAKVTKKEIYKRVDSGYMVQLGAYTSNQAANSVKRKLDAIRQVEGALPVVQETTTLAGQDLIHLKLGPFSSKVEAEQMQAMVKAKTGMNGGTIVDNGEW
ncbi:serine/threonine protein kinase [Magnetococcus marinus MC-1]|uniref:Serine/threonine protein kinase n=1 Tax=Magnetococcus marinus (strain ATCC BAA-1437 / JCM 17883 / MC-1) TaxID=156889 RepID=A0LE03_MAGMM|nr:SPOR domain-containing protein [Magnetococcus marinus]ABK46196.1 serine/threonine protein kinase [Magnetococcus marinus MC-1]